MAKNPKRNKQIQRVRGVRDVLPNEHAKRKHVLETIETVFHKYGYQGVEVPTIESIELHVRKSGESIRRHMYQFKDLGEENLCLRPELTASVARMYDQSLRSESKPLRLSYSGPSFRYDRPQKGRYREFTQVGTEIVGGVGPEYDAETIAIACHVMDALGISEYRVVIGNIGLTLDLLKQKQVLEKAQSVILTLLEAIGKTPHWDKEQKLKTIEDALRDIHISMGSVPLEKQCVIDAIDQIRISRNSIVEKPFDSDSRPPEEILIAWVLDQAERVDSRRSRSTPEDTSLIAQNLLKKVERYKQGPVMREVLDFLGELMDVSGTGPEVFSSLHALVEKYQLNTSRVTELESTIRYLKEFNIDWNKVKIDFSFGRGLEYYTGVIFEIHCDSDRLGTAQTQVCGGGRYDTLIRIIGGHEDVPALGFSFGLERLVLAMAEDKLEKPAYLDVLVAAVGSENEFCAALNLATRLREQNLRVTVGSKGRTMKAQTSTADKLNIPYVIYLGENELKSNSVTLKELNTGDQSECTFDEALKIIRRGVN